ncbi:MAG: acetyl-CoA carboxylase biotin carboxyl carrier protein [Ruminococcus sp.]
MSDKYNNMMDIETIEQLADLVVRKELGEITISDGDRTITVKGKKCPPPPPMSMPVSMAAAPAAAPAAPAAPAPAPAAAAPAPAGNIVKAPIVGTFYAAASPDEPPYVKVGDAVKKGDVLMIIESMKLMNEVVSDFDGVVEEIFVANGDAVEYDQPLMRIC